MKKDYGQGKTFNEEARSTTFLMGMIFVGAGLFWLAFVAAAIGVALGWW